MSAFLGPIHFWLYDKIGNQEQLTKTLADYAEQQGWIDNRKEYICDLQPLETVIDEGNIHGWLQACLSYAEQRYADLITEILSADQSRIETFKELAFAFGKSHRVTADSPSDIYSAFEDFFVNGMPCDRVNAVTSESADELSWQMSQDIHAAYWGGDASVYYALRSRVMDGMLDGGAFCLVSEDNARYSIKRK